MKINKFDYLYRKLLLTKYFVNGWGDPEKLKRWVSFGNVLIKNELFFDDFTKILVFITNLSQHDWKFSL